MLFALRQREIARTEGILHGEGQARLPGIAVDLPGLIRECPLEFLRHKTRWDRGRQTFQGPSIQLPKHGNRVEQAGIPLLGSKREMQKLGKIFAETGRTRQEAIPIAPFLKPLKRAEIAQGASELTFIGLLPEVGLREGVLVRPVQEPLCRLQHNINGAFLPLAQLTMLLFIAMSDVPAHLRDVLVMHQHEVIQETLACLQ